MRMRMALLPFQTFPDKPYNRFVETITPMIRRLLYLRFQISR